jgi:hypothetical protein
MQRLLARFALKGPPYANTNDFLKLLREEAGPQNDALITDLFEKITLLDLKASDANVRMLADGKYEVKVNIDARKFYADGAGQETEATMDEMVDVGVFDRKPGDPGFGPSNVLYLQPTRIQRDAAALGGGKAPAPRHGRWVSPFFDPAVAEATAATAARPLSLVVDSRPTWIGIDPYNKRIDRNSDDNLTAVELK